jgi:GNAT superfamily N-acetyltransferase
VSRLGAASPEEVSIRRLAKLEESDIAQLAQVLIDCVEGGASVSFMHPLTPARAQDFWRGVAREIETGGRVLLAASDPDGIVGTVQLVFAWPENQPHRADLEKMLVHRRARGRGIGAALMRAAEAGARAAGKTLLVLDTATGSEAERLYARLGWIRVGSIPGYAQWPHGGFCSTTFYYRKLD